MITRNKVAFFNYEILERYTAGIKLVGSEVKAIKTNKVSITEAYCFVMNNEIFIKNMHVAENKEGGKHYNHQPLRERKLLLNKKEIIKLFEKSSQKGLTIIPLEVSISNTGFVKIEIGLGRGKHTYDKKQSIKEKDLKRDMDRAI